MANSKFFSNIFDPWLVESSDAEPEDLDGWLYYLELKASVGNYKIGDTM